MLRLVWSQLNARVQQPLHQVLCAAVALVACL